MPFIPGDQHVEDFLPSVFVARTVAIELSFPIHGGALWLHPELGLVVLHR